MSTARPDDAAVPTPADVWARSAAAAEKPATPVDGPVVIFVGMPGTGKSTIGKRVAGLLGVPFVDTDDLIASLAGEHEGETCGEVFARVGEAVFRDLEERVIAAAVASHRGVLSLGGGACLSASTRSLLKPYRVVHLTTSVAEGVCRTSDHAQRPVLAGDAGEDPSERYRRLLAERAPHFREVAAVSVSTEYRPPASSAADVLHRLGLEPVASAQDDAVGQQQSVQDPEGKAQLDKDQPEEEQL